MPRDKIIVTGGAGYIGSHTVVCLLEQGFDVVIVDNLINSSIPSLDGISAIAKRPFAFFQVDICDKPALLHCFDIHKNAKAVIHFAALKSVGDSVANPLAYYQNNISGFINVLDAMHEFSIPNLIFSSSATVYGEPDELPVLESHPLKPSLSPYGASKRIGEDMIRDMAIAKPGFSSIILRYFNPVGAHESALIGEIPVGVPSNLMPFITQTACGIRDELKVFGNDYNTPDGTCIRDYIHVIDLAESHIVALERVLEGKAAGNVETFNVGTGLGYSVLEVIQSFERTSGLKLSYSIADRRPGDASVVYASTKLANETLGWKAKKTLDDMTRSAWNWEKQYRGM
ncbi:MAG: UDP-glucose 4-epimerase GalE [Bacteroidota bacterium]